ncbi:MAG: 16S rRNA (guanine(527)-N(7))-methyltransferase RsmG [Opitutales bacterium]
MERIKPWFPEINDDEWVRLECWAALMREWNAKVNLVSRKDIEALEEHHLAPCLAVVKVLKLMHGARVLDIGTGGGLPGLIMAQHYSQAHFVLVDSVGKKVRVVEDIAQRLGLKNVDTYHGRAETLSREFDFVTGRAVTALPDFLRWAAPRLRAGRKHSLPNGVLYWRGGAVEDWLADARAWHLHHWLPVAHLQGKHLLHLTPALAKKLKAPAQ